MLLLAEPMVPLAPLLALLQLAAVAAAASCHVHVHHTLGCYNDSDWQVGAAGPVLPHFVSAVASDKRATI